MYMQKLYDRMLSMWLQNDKVTTNQIFIQKQVLEKCYEFGIDYYI